MDDGVTTEGSDLRPGEYCRPKCKTGAGLSTRLASIVYVGTCQASRA